MTTDLFISLQSFNKKYDVYLPNTYSKPQKKTSKSHFTFVIKFSKKFSTL